MSCLAYPVFCVSKRSRSHGLGFETEFGSYPSFYAALILLNGVVHVFTRADYDEIVGLFQQVFSITLHNAPVINWV